MKTQFSRTPRRARNALITPGQGMMVVVVVFVALLLLILRAVFPGVTASLASPLWSAGDGISNGMNGFFAQCSEQGNAVVERARLVRENTVLTERMNALAVANADLVRLVGTRTEAGVGIVASVLARPPVSPYDTLVLDQGEVAGVTKNHQVLGPGGAPLGTIESVSATSARVLLYSAPGRVTEGWVGDARLPITLRGVGGGAFTASVPRDALVTVGQSVFLPVAGARTIGTIIRVDTNPSSPEAIVHIRPVSNPFSIVWVEIR